MAASPSTPPFKYTVTHHRAKGVSQEAFSKWFHEEHVPKGVALMKKHGIVKYSVMVRDAQLCDSLKPDLEALYPTWELSTADLVLEYWLHDLDCLRTLVADPDWLGVACLDQEKWVDMERCTLHLGHDSVYLEDGEPKGIAAV